MGLFVEDGHRRLCLDERLSKFLVFLDVSAEVGFEIGDGLKTLQQIFRRAMMQ